MTGPAAHIDGYRERLAAAGLAKYSDELTALLRPSIRLVADATEQAPQRRSRLGGLPELPTATVWPQFHEQPLSFIAQIDLADVSPYDVDGVLPRDGLLSFFYEAVTQQNWGFDPADRGSAAILYTPVDTPTTIRDWPADLPQEGRFTPVALLPRPETVAAPWESYDVERIGLTGRDGRLAYAELIADEGEVIHRLLGHPAPVQGDMQLECQLVTAGLDCGRPAGYQDPRAKDLESGAADWRLLLQVDSQDEAGMMWGDLGRLYYWMRGSDLAAHNWDAAWLILQCS